MVNAPTESSHDEHDAHDGHDDDDTSIHMLSSEERLRPERGA
jgi:hypothetical protein